MSVALDDPPSYGHRPRLVELVAAAHLAGRGLAFTVLEAGDGPAAATPSPAGDVTTGTRPKPD